MTNSILLELIGINLVTIMISLEEIFVQKIENYIGKTILNRLSMDIEEYKGKDCFVVECEAHNGDESTFTYVQSLKDKNVKEMFVRTEGKVVKLEGKDLADFILQNKKP